MPIRITCPSCSAVLNLKDELAGRAVKCPKCAAVVPASATQPKPAAPAFEVVEDEPPKPAAKLKPAPPKPPKAAVVVDEDDEEDAPRPKRRGKPATPSRDKKIILGMVGYWVLAVAVSLWLSIRDTNPADTPDGTVSGDTTASRPSNVAPQNLRTKFDSLIQRMPRADLEAVLGPGEVATAADYNADASAFGTARTAWKEQIDRGRVLVWKSGTDKLFVCLTAAPPARLQAQRLHSPAFMPRVAGEVDDETFIRDSPGEVLPAKFRDDPKWSGIKTHFATALLQEYEENRARAARRYGELWIDVYGNIQDIEAVGETGLAVVLKGRPESPGTVVRIAIDPTVRGVLEFSPGDPVTIRAKCVGMQSGVLSFTGGRTPQAAREKVASAQSSALGLLLSYGTDAKVADETFKGKPVRLNAGIVESREADGSLILAPDQGKSQLRVRVTFGPTWKDRFARFKPGDKIHIRGVCQGLTGNRVTVEKAWPVPAP